MTIWKLELKGDVRHLKFLAEACGKGARKVLHDEWGTGYLYESDSFHSCSTSREVEQLAKDEVAILSGILKLECGVRASLNYGAILRLNPTGRPGVFVSLQPVQAQGEIGTMAVGVTDAAGDVIAQPAPPPHRSAVRLQLATTDAAIAKVLRLLDASDAMTWNGLHRIHEVIEQDVGGQHKLEKQGWRSADDLRRFKHSANSPQVSGDQSRHGKETQAPPQNPMTLVEAEAYADGIVQAWLASKGG
jgi:hypothetical protein